MATAVNGNGNDRAEKIYNWALEHGDVFRGGEVAEFLGVPTPGVGPTLSAMVRAGTLHKTTKDGKTAYMAAPIEPPSVEELARPEFIVNLKQSLADRLAVLHEERSKLDAQLREIDDEADRIRAAFGALSHD